jgi:magnesium transporter
MIVDNAIYVNGHRAAEPASLEETYEACRKQHGLAWIGLYESTVEEFSSVAEEFGLHPLVVKDAIKAHQRPKCGLNFRRGAGILRGSGPLRAMPRSNP